MEKDNIVCSDMDLIMEMLNEDDTKYKNIRRSTL